MYFGLWAQRVACLVHGVCHLALFQAGMRRTEADHHPLTGIGQRVRCNAGTDLVTAWQGLQVSEADHLSVLAAYAGLLQFIAPLVLAGALATPSYAGICFNWLLGLIQAQHSGGGHGLHTEGAADAQLLAVHLRLVEQRFLLGVRADAAVHFALQGDTCGLEGIEGIACGSRPCLWKVEGHFPFQQRTGRCIFAAGQLLRAALS